jgi:hypothetical protein
MSSKIGVVQVTDVDDVSSVAKVIFRHRFQDGRPGEDRYSVISAGRRSRTAMARRGRSCQFPIGS